MARQLRIEYEGAFYHVTSRGNQKGRIFWEDIDRTKFKDILRRTKERYRYFLHGYVMMNNHYHLLIETPHANLKQIMQNINTSYTVYINRTRNKFGHLFQGRYKSFIVDKENYLVELSRYIHLNPVRAGIVNRPQEYLWSSYRDYIHKGEKDAITDMDDTLILFSKRRDVAVKKYKEFIYAGITGNSPLENAVGSILGDEAFTERAASHIKVYHDKSEIPDIKRIRMRIAIKDIVKRIADHYDINPEEILRRKQATVNQRKIAIYLSKILSGKKNVEVGKIFGITVPAVTNAVRDIERRKEKEIKLNNLITLIKRKIEG